jgi:two-component system, LuxR family, sensor kinase FixL
MKTDAQSEPPSRETKTISLDRRTLISGLLVFAGYYLGAKIGFALTFKPRPVSVLWPPNSILFAALLLTPRRAWWFLLVAALPAHWLVQLQSDVPPLMILCWFISNCCEALTAAICVRHFIARPVRLDRLSNVAIFCFCGVFLGPFLSSFLDAAFVVANHWGTGTYWGIWRIRFTSNVLAAITITPLIITWATERILPWRGISWRRLLELICLFGGLLALGFTLFNKISSDADLALLYTPLPFLLWAAVRFGSRGVITAIASCAFLAIWGVAHGAGPFAENTAEENALYVQLFIIFMSLPLLLLAGLIEERTRTEEILREREERLSLAAETGSLALWTIDFERRESWMSDRGRELFGFGPNEPLSREVFLSRVHAEDRAYVEEALERARNATRNFEVEYRLVRPNGETRWLISRGRYRVNESGQLSELMGVAIDVTAQVKANVELRLQREEMTRLSRVALMGELTASLAHELNQPLTAIASNAAAGKRFLASDPANTKMFEEILSDVFADARRAGGIIHGIHHFVKKGEGTRDEVSLNEIIREVLRLLHSDLLGRAATVETELASNLPAVQADPIHMQQVLLNLIMNSLEAMHETEAKRRRILISTRASNGSVYVSVRDHGAGLPVEDPNKIFGHFFSTKPNGMGMGLTIARSIVEAHGGELGAENLGDGARLFFCLPVKTASA